MIRIPYHWTTEEALLVAAFLDDVVDAIRDVHGDPAAAATPPLAGPHRRTRPDLHRPDPTPPDPRPRVPGHWTADQATLFTDFLAHLLDAIWRQHEAAMVDLIIDHLRVPGGCRCRICSPNGLPENEDGYDPADDDGSSDDIPL